MEADDGMLARLSADKIWLGMSTTDEAGIRRTGALVEAKGAFPVNCPVSGGYREYIHFCREFARNL